MAENSLLGSTIVAVLGLAAMLWLPSQIRGVWRGERSAPWLPIRTTDRFLGRKVFEVTDRNFPAFGTALLCMGGFAFCLGASIVAKQLGFPGLEQPLVVLGVALLPVAFAFAFIAALIHWTGSPAFLVPPALRERESEPTTRSEGGADSETTTPAEESETAIPTEEREATSRSEGILDPDGLLDRAVIVVVAVVAGFVAGVPVWLVASGVSVVVGLTAGILAWFGAGAYLIRRRSLNAAISTAAYAIALAIMVVPLVVFDSTFQIESTPLFMEFTVIAIMCAVPAAVVAGIGVLAGRYIPEPSPDG